MNIDDLSYFKGEIQAELDQILEWWIAHAPDHQNGGFYGKIDNENNPSPEADKGLVLHARILYTFSAAFTRSQKPEHLSMADRAFKYLTTYFLDKKNGGFYWSITCNGRKQLGKKQIYGQAFAIYGLAEYYKATLKEEAISLAKETFLLLETHSFDKIYSGYLEALTEEWKTISDLRLSEKDQNEKKSMNTHLHVLEAYANLYPVWPNKDLRSAIYKLLGNFESNIFNNTSHHLNLFFTEKWELKSTTISFGHDIEAAWLLQEAAEVINNKEKIATFRHIGDSLTKAASKGLAASGGIYYELEPATHHWIYEYHWWPQAEAMVGFLDAYKRSGNGIYLDYTMKIWSFIKAHLKDKKNGEWFWGVKSLMPDSENLSPMQNEDKVGFWKCPYHNGRACMELLKRLAYD